MSETVTDIVINASGDDVWRVLSNFSEYPEWNPYFRRVSGTLQIDETLSITRMVPGQGEVQSDPKVSLYRPGREIRLLERPVLPGLMDIEHGLKLEPLGPEQVRFVHWHITSGILAPIVGGWSNKGLREQLEAMNHAFKQRVEGGPVPATKPADDATSGRERAVA